MLDSISVPEVVLSCDRLCEIWKKVTEQTAV